MNSLAGQWWQSVDIWAIIIPSVLSMLLGVLGTWATLRAGKTKHKLGWWEKSNTPLFPGAGQPQALNLLSIQLGNTRLQKPRLIELEIVNLGQADITAAMFHGGAALQFSFGAPVLLTMPSSPRFLVTNLGTTPSAGGVEIPPCLLRKGRSLTVTVLVDSDVTATSCLSFPLVDVAEVTEPPGARVVSFAGFIAEGVMGSLFGLRSRP